VSGRHSKAKKRDGIPAVYGENNAEVATETKLMWVSLKGKEGRRRTFDGAEKQKRNGGFHEVKRRLTQCCTTVEEITGLCHTLWAAVLSVGYP